VERGSAQREFRDQRAAQCQDLLGETCVLLRVNFVDSGSENGNGFAFGGESASMGGSVGAARHAAEDDQAVG